TDMLVSTWRLGATAATRARSVNGLPRPRLPTALASTLMNSWFRRIRLRSLSGSCGQVRGSVLVTPGGLYCRWRALKTARDWQPFRVWHPAVGTFKLASPSYSGMGKYILMP